MLQYSLSRHQTQVLYTSDAADTGGVTVHRRIYLVEDEKSLNILLKNIWREKAMR
jgi:hypothetical protein